LAFEGDNVWNEAPAQSGVIDIARRFARELVQRIATRPQELAEIEWRDLERLLFEVFNALGFEAELTRPAKDGGYDIQLRADGFLYLVEIKHWSEKSKVGLGIVARFTEVVVSKGAEGLLISSSGSTNKVVKARSKIFEHLIVLGSDRKVISLCRHYVQSENGLWISKGGLREVFFEDAL
jgi:Restriction endonuclease